MKQAFYPGAGLDLDPPLVFRSIKSWFYVDSRPRYEYGESQENQEEFIDELKSVMEKNGFTFMDQEGDVYLFSSETHHQTIVYETNAIFPTCLHKHHLDCDTLVLCGYQLNNPPPSFLEHYPYIITNSKTVHDVDIDVELSHPLKTVYTIMYDAKERYVQYIIPHFISYEVLHKDSFVLSPITLGVFH